MNQELSKICIIGIWHQGAVAAACMTELGYHVVGVDFDQTRINDLNNGKAPLYEPGLDDLLRNGITSGRLSFTTSLAEGLSDTNQILMMFDTPVDENDEVDLTDIFRIAGEMAPYILPQSLLLVTAQVPIGTCDRIADIILKANPLSNIQIAYCPENLRLGHAIDRFKNPPLPVIGANDEETLNRAEKLLSVLTVSWMRVNLHTAEMTKHALNAFLAVSICFANELGNLCDAVGADGLQIGQALRIEPRIGSKAMVFPGLGFSGGTLARDMKALLHLSHKYDVATPLFHGAWQSNQQQNRLVTKILQKVFGSLDDLNVCILGLTYKPDTSTLRRSASIEIITELGLQGAHVTAYDPKADMDELENYTGFKICLDAYTAANGSDVLILITPWSEFKNLDFKKIYSMMEKPVIFDTQNILNKDMLTNIGFTYFGIGRGMAIKQNEVNK